MKALMKELSSKGLNSKQKFNISENSYRSSVTPLQRFILRFKQYVIYPLQLIISLIGRQNSSVSSDLSLFNIVSQAFVIDG